MNPATALVLLALVFPLAGCHFQRRAVDMRAVESQIMASSEPVPAGPDGPVYVTAPRRVAIVRLEPVDAGQFEEGRGAGERAVRIVNEAATERQSEDLASRVSGVEIVRLAEDAGPGSVHGGVDLVAVGRRAGADWLVPFTVQTGHKSDINVFTLLTLPAHIATAGYLPIQSVSADSTVAAIIVDVRAGRVVDRFEQKKATWQLTNARGTETAGRQAGDRAENRAVRALLDAVDERIERLNDPGHPGRTRRSEGWGGD